MLTDVELERSSVVANSRMNRGRVLTGGNGYAKELGLHPLEWLAEHRFDTWLDLCCGEGRALAEAGALAPHVRITGVDLAGRFVKAPPNVELVEASLSRWQPSARFGLITCVHGLHYLGDKLGLLARAAAWLESGGLLLANVDLRNLRGVSRAQLSAAGISYARRRFTVRGPLSTPWRYLGADDSTGPNYTGQPAVTSLYESSSRKNTRPPAASPPGSQKLPTTPRRPSRS